MDKYAVVTEEEAPEAPKKASVPSCPKCGTTISKDSNVAHCATHGTKPFESEDENIVE